MRNITSDARDHIDSYIRKIEIVLEPFVVTQHIKVDEEVVNENLKTNIDHYIKMAPVAQGTINANRVREILEKVVEVEASFLDSEEITKVEEEPKEMALGIAN